MDFTQETVTWIINGIFAFFVVMGFLFGAARGVKKSALRFAFLAVIGTTMYFAAPYISSWLLSYNFSSLVNTTIDLNGTPHTFTTVKAFLTAFIESNQALNEFVAQNSSFEVLVQQLPTIITNLVVFIVGFWALKILTWPIYAIASIGYNKRREDGEKPKKHRFAGAMLGAVQGFAIVLITFLPIAGVSSILSVEGTSGSGTLLGALVPEEVSGYFSVYENSALGQVGGVGNFDNSMFDGLTTIKIKDKETGEVLATIRPRQDAVTSMQIVSDIERLIDMVEEIQQAVEDGQPVVINWVLIEDLVDKIFELNTLQLVMEQYAPYLVDEATSNSEYGVSDRIDEMPISEDVRAFLTEFKDGFNEVTIAKLKSDVLAVLGIGKALDEHGVLELVFKQAANKITANDMLEQILEIFGTNHDLSSDIMTSVLNSNSVKTLMPATINMALGYMEHFINETREDEIDITRINVDEMDWELETYYLTEIMYNMFAFVHSINPFDMGDVEPLDLIASFELSRLGEVVNLIRETQLFGGIYDSVIEAALTMPEVVDMVGEYIILEDLKDLLIKKPSTDPEALDWVEEFVTIEQLLDLVVLLVNNEELNIEEIQNIIANLDSSLLEFAIDGAIRAVFIEMFNENIGSVEEGVFSYNTEFEWLDKLSLKAISANAEFFANMMGFVFDVAENGIENLTYDQLQVLVDAVEEIDYNENLTQTEIDDFKLFFDDLLHYMFDKIDSDLTWAQDISVDDFINNIDTIIELFTLAMAIEDGSIYDYTPEEIANLVAEVSELNDDLSVEMTTVLQGFYDEFMAENSPLLVNIDIENIDFAVEGEIIGDLLTLYINHENEVAFDDVLALELVQSLQNSHIAEQVITALIEQVVEEEEMPLWISTVDMTWVEDNEGLVVVLLETALWSQDNDMADMTQTQIDALQAEIDNIPETPQYVEFTQFMQDFLDGISA